MNYKQLFGIFLIVLLVNNSIVEAQRNRYALGYRGGWPFFRNWPYDRRSWVGFGPGRRWRMGGRRWGWGPYGGFYSRSFFPGPFFL